MATGRTLCPPGCRSGYFMDAPQHNYTQLASPDLRPSVRAGKIVFVVDGWPSTTGPRPRATNFGPLSMSGRDALDVSDRNVQRAASASTTPRGGAGRPTPHSPGLENDAGYSQSQIQSFTPAHRVAWPWEACSRGGWGWVCINTRHARRKQSVERVVDYYQPHHYRVGSGRHHAPFKTIMKTK
jgi:hypothetical protein